MDEEIDGGDYQQEYEQQQDYQQQEYQDDGEGEAQGDADEDGYYKNPVEIIYLPTTLSCNVLKSHF